MYLFCITSSTWITNRVTAKSWVTEHFQSPNFTIDFQNNPFWNQITFNTAQHHNYRPKEGTQTPIKTQSVFKDYGLDLKESQTRRDIARKKDTKYTDYFLFRQYLFIFNNLNALFPDTGIWLLPSCTLTESESTNGEFHSKI